MTPKESSSKKSAPRVFIGLREVAGLYRSLKNGFDQIGVDNVFVCLGHDKFDYKIENNPKWAETINNLFRRLSIAFHGNWLSRILWIGIFQNIFGGLLFLAVFWRYDVFIFGSVSTFFFFLELPILRLFGKKVIHVFNGSDSRPVYINGFVIQDHGKPTIFVGIVLAKIQKLIITIVEMWSTTIINIPPQSHYHTRKIANAYIVGYSFEQNSEASSVQQAHAPQPADASRPVRIVHAPSKPGPKGTDTFRRAIASLKSKGYNIDWVEVIGRPNREVLAEIQNCDFVVDQLYSDMPLAVFAIEAAFFGKPAVVGGYYSREISKLLTPEEIPPSFYCLPEEIESSIEKMIVDSAMRAELGKKAAQFVRTKWSPRKVAENYLKLISNEAPDRWYFDPNEIDYLEGCGHSKEQGKKTLAAFVKMGGRSSLCLNDKPKLRDRFIKWSKEQPTQSTNI